MGLIGAGAGFLGSLISSFANGKLAKKQYREDMNDINSTGTYSESPYAGKNLGLAQNLFNGRMAGANAAEENIYQNQANSGEAIDATATDASQALALKAALSTGANDSFAKLAQDEAVDKMRRAGLVMDANNTMISEGTKVWDDRLRQMNQRMGVRHVRTQNKSNMWQGIGDSVGYFGNMVDYFNQSNKNKEK